MFSVFINLVLIPQAFVKMHHSINGYAEVTLKNFDGVELYHNKIFGNFWWDGAEYYGPKWGLYRYKNEDYNESDFIYFKNVQIWKN